MSVHCLVTTDKIKEMAKKFEGETPETLTIAIGAWQVANQMGIEEYPTVKELQRFLDNRKKTKEVEFKNTSWGRQSDNGYEVSTAGDSRFSALNATFKEGTEIAGADVSGKTIEEVYQKVVKKSGKGKAPSKNSKLHRTSVNNYTGNITPDANTVFVFGSNPEGRHGAGAAKIARKQFGAIYRQGEGLQGNAYALPTKDLRVKESNSLRSISSKQIIESIKKLYETARKNPDKQFKVAYRNTDKASLNGYTGLEMIDMFLKAGSIPTNIVFSKEWVDTGKFNLSREELEDFSYTEGYLPLWQKWAEQNEDLIEDLANKASGKVLTDKFANTRVSQARALSEIINDFYVSKQQINKSEITSNKAFEINKVTTLNQQALVDLDLSATKRRDREFMIASLFSTALEDMVAKRGTELQNLYTLAQSLGNTEQAESYKKELARLSKASILNSVGPVGVFEKIRIESIDGYLQLSDKQKLDVAKQEVLRDAMDSLEEGESIDDILSEEELIDYANEDVAYKTKEYEKISRNFQALAEGSCAIIQFTENIKIFPADKKIDTTKDQTNIEAESGQVVNEDMDNALGREDSPMESWMLDYRHTSSQDSLSEEVRKAIRSVPMIVDGEVQIDDLGYVRYLDPSYVHATLISGLRHMTKPEHMYQLLDKLSAQKPWVVEIVNTIKGDEVLESKFYQNYRKDFMPYWIMTKKTLPSGDFTFETIPINQPEGIYYLIDSWRDNYESNNKLSKFSVYNSKGEIDLDNAEFGYDLVQELQDEYAGMDQEELEKYLTPEKLNVLKELMGGLGMTVNQSLFKTTLTSYPGTFDVGSELNIFNLLEKLNVIYKGVSDGIIKKEYREDGSEYTGDLINTFDSAYKAIATMFAEVTTDAIESSVRENGKTYYSHVKPSYLNKMIKKLKGIMSDPQEYADYMEDEYGKYEFFKRDGEWQNIWLRLMNDEKTAKDARELLDHKVVLNYDKRDYTNWDDLDYYTVMLNEYFSMPEDYKGSLDYAWYYQHILSDAPTSEFIKFVRYRDKYQPYIVDGKETNYQGKIAHELTNLVLQEYHRIMLVRDRADKIQKGADIKPIANYDMVLDSNGDIIKIGGAEFKFLPILNKVNFKGEVIKKGEKTFLDELVEKANDPSQEVTLKQDVADLMQKVLDIQFESEYRKFAKAGILDVSKESQTYKYLPFRNQNKHNENMFKRMQKAKQLLSPEVWTREQTNLMEAYKNNEVLLSDAYINKTLEYTKQQLEELIEENPEARDEIGIILQNLEEDNFTKEKLREFFYNNTLAQSQMIQLTSSDLAFYANMKEFQKRAKQVHSPSNRLNTLATYKGVRYGKLFERAVYLKDEYLMSSVYDEIVEAVKENENLSEAEKLAIVSKFSSNVVTDGQAFRSIDSYRDILVMLGEMTDESFQAIENFKKGKWSAEDFEVLWQTKKPFVYTQLAKDSGTGSNIKVPINHKNSEFLLMVGHAIVAGTLNSKNLTMGKSGKLRALNNWMLANKIDVVHFESAVKVGNQGIVDLNYKEPLEETTRQVGDHKVTFSSVRELNKELANLLKDQKITKEQSDKVMEEFLLTDEEEVAQALYEATGLGDGKFIKDVDPQGGVEDVIHYIDYEDYGIQTETPEHILDTDLALGTQIRKLIMADISAEAELLLEGKVIKPVLAKDGTVLKTSKEVWRDYYNEIVTENIIKSFEQLEGDFNSIEKIEEIILDEIRGNDRYSKDLLYACQLQEETIINENGQEEVVKRFNLPLFDPVQSIRIQNLLNSIIKSRVTKQRMKGGSLIQVSNYGLNNDLHIVFDKDSKGKKRIKHIECMMPWYTKQFLEPLMTEGTHELDISKVPESLRQLIGYRVPTEDKYSMIPLYIKGFTPRQNGSVIMLPTDITTLTGADFDIDKLYILIPEFRKYSKFNVRESWNNFYKEHPELVQEIKDAKLDAFDEFLDRAKDELGIDPENLSDEEYFDLFDQYNKKNKREGVKNYDYLEGVQEQFSEWLKIEGNKVDYEHGIEKIEYDYSKPAKDQSLAARNNAIIDLMWSVLTSSDTTEKILRGGNYDAQKRASRIITFIENIHYEDLLKLGDINDVIKMIQEMDLDSLDELVEIYKEELNPLAASTQVYFHQQNMTGLALIGIYANHNANHALMQYTDLGIIGDFTLNGKTYSDLNQIKNSEGQYISSIIAGYLAASVDNAKDPVLLALNQNQFTADAGMLLIRLGFNPTEVGLFLTQPVIKNITERVSKEQRYGKSIDDIVEEEIVKLAKVTGKSSLIQMSSINNALLTNANFITNKINYKRMKEDLNLSDKEVKNLNSNQLEVAIVFKELLKSSSALGDLVLAMRADTTKGGAGPSIADTIIKLLKLADVKEDSLKLTYPLRGSDVLNDYIEYKDIDDLRHKLINSKLPFLQAFHTLGLEKTGKLLEKYFPFYNRNFQDIIKEIKGVNKYDRIDAKTINSIFQDFMAFYLTSTEFFGDERNQDGELVVTKEEKRAAFLNDYPSEYEKIMKAYPALLKIPFLKQIKYIKPGKNNPIPLLVFKEVGRLSPNRRDEMMRDWQSLMSYPDPVGPQLAMNLIRYSFFRNGLGFGPNTFSHLAPTLLRMAIPEYRETLYKMSMDDRVYKNFKDQYIRNHMENRRLVPEVDVDKFNKIIDSKKMPQEFKLDLANYKSEPVKAITKTLRKKRGRIVGAEALEYITFRVKGKNYYYQKLSTNDDLNGRYMKVEPLNYKNNSLEYDINSSALDMESQVNPILVNVDSGYRSYDFTPQDIAENFVRPTYSTLDLQAFEDMSDLASDDIESNSDFDIVFGDMNEKESLNKVPPVQDFRDADDLPGC